ncbi:MAG: hypothetical protein HN849_12995 [Victivallales bacterium]|jgi:hypothetical protein|nr:hypothetical protein [Victivallales bacterium]MBT7300430.1 hypothetical protein [Victivallales bacterium]
MRIVTIGLVCVALAGRCLLADPLNGKRVSAQARWVAHLNLEQLNKSGIGSLLFLALATEKGKQRLGEFREEFGFDPLTDLRSVTVYGKGPRDEDAVALFRGVFDGDRLVALARASDSYEQSGHHDQTIHGWVAVTRGRRELSYGCLAADDTVVVSRSPAMVKEALDVLARRKANITSVAGLADLLPRQPTALLVVMADLENLEHVSPNATVLRSARNVRFSLTGDLERISASLALTATGEATATHLHGAIGGLISLMALNAQENPELRILTQALRVSRHGTSLRVELACPARQALDLLKAGITKAKALHEANQR